MKLKTLKDIDVWAGNKERFVAVDKLKEEAIKWVKNCKVITGFSLECKDTNLEYKCLGCLRMMKFHNITEEELKSEDKRREEWEECEEKRK